MIVFAGVFILLVSSIQGEVKLSLHGVDISGLKDKEPIRIIEGSGLVLGCTSNYSEASITWHAIDGSIHVNHTLEIKRIRIEDAGQYQCRVIISMNGTTNTELIEVNSVFLEILYPPSSPVIEGNSVGLRGEEVRLTCVSDSRPQPTYQWRKHTIDGVIISRNQTYKTIISGEDYAIVCIVQTLMITTLEAPRSESLSRGITVSIRIMAYVDYVSGGHHRYFNEGNNINIACSVRGIPSPKAWWTKVGNDNFYFQGKVLIQNSVEEVFAGDYTCHAENTIIIINKTSITTHGTQTISINVHKKTGDTNCTECVNQYEASLELTTNTMKTASQPANILKECTERISPDRSVSEYSDIERILIAATGVGWTAFIFSTMVNIWICRKRKPDNDTQSAFVRHQSSPSPENLDNLRRLPAEPSYISEVRFTDNTYTDLTNYDHINAMQIDSSSSTGLQSDSTITSTDTYIQPTA